jgi:hypothetical protein
MTSLKFIKIINYLMKTSLIFLIQNIVKKEIDIINNIINMKRMIVQWQRKGVHLMIYFLCIMT